MNTRRERNPLLVNHLGNATPHRYSHSALQVLGGERGKAHYYQCLVTNAVRVWGFDGT